jgi:GxxExxY protein
VAKKGGYVADVIHKQLSYEVMAATFEVHNVLGPGFLEKVYEKALLQELILRRIEVEPQKQLTVLYKGKEIGIYCADLVIENKIILELKAVENLSNIHQAQVLNYLKATGFNLGLLINFGKERIEYKRLVL